MINVSSFRQGLPESRTQACEDNVPLSRPMRLVPWQILRANLRLKLPAHYRSKSTHNAAAIDQGCVNFQAYILALEYFF
jgi:hypothetical protein